MAAGIGAVASGLGSMLGKKLMDKIGGGDQQQQGQYMDSQIPGIKTGPGGVSLVDPTIALDYFKQASARQESGFKEGLTHYKEAVKLATQTIKEGYLASDNILRPLSYASGEALNEQLRMMGLDPLPATVGMSQAMRVGFDGYGETAPDEWRGAVSKLGSEMDAAARIKNPTERKNALSALQQKFNETNDFFASDTIARRTALDSEKSKYNMLEMTTPLGNADSTSFTKLNLWEQNPNIRASAKESYDAFMEAPEIGVPGDPVGYKVDYGSLIQGGVYDSNGKKSMSDSARQYKHMAIDKPAWESKDIKLKELEKNSSKIRTDMDQYRDSFTENYSEEYDKGYTGDQISNKISTLPGYQFNLEQGIQTLDRSAAAKGMLQSRNAELAVQEFGQGQAQKYYDTYMGYLQNTVNTGTPATFMLSSNALNRNKDISNLQMLYGTAAMDTSRQIATYGANILKASGELFNETSIANAGFLNQALGQNKQIAADMAKEQAKQNAAKEQSAGQGLGAAYGSGGGGGGQTGIPYGTVSPGYTGTYY